MKADRLVWFLGTIQYGIFLFGGGAVWFIVASATGFFGGDLANQVMACLLLVALVVAESWWAHLPAAGSEIGNLLVDFLTSAAIAGSGMAVVLGILLWLPH